MDEQEAEAAVLALGTQLRWRAGLASVPGGLYKYVPFRRKRFLWRQASEWYTVFRWFSQQDETDVCPRKYDVLAEAKAACERHYATGKWD